MSKNEQKKMSKKSPVVGCFQSPLAKKLWTQEHIGVIWKEKVKENLVTAVVHSFINYYY